MQEKLIISRKEHKCGLCARPILKGQQCMFMFGKEPRFADDHETQIGIEYIKVWYCKIVPDCEREFVDL